MLVLILMLRIGIPAIMTQDVVSLKSGSEIKVRILSLGTKTVNFIPENSFDTADLLRDEISILHYGSGIIIYLSENEIPTLINVPGNDGLFDLGKIDATRY